MKYFVCWPSHTHINIEEHFQWEQLSEILQLHNALYGRFWFSCVTTGQQLHRHIVYTRNEEEINKELVCLNKSNHFVVNVSSIKEAHYFINFLCSLKKAHYVSLGNKVTVLGSFPPARPVCASAALVFPSFQLPNSPGFKTSTQLCVINRGNEFNMHWMEPPWHPSFQFSGGPSGWV